MTNAKVIRRNLILAVLGAVVCSGCSRWPPYGEYLFDLVEQRNEEFLALESLFLESGMTEACHGAAAGDVVADFLGEKAAPVRSPTAFKLRQHLERTDMYCVLLLEDNAVGFKPYYQRSVNGYEYEIRITHHTKTGAVSECTEISVPDSHGYCVIELEDAWQVEYSWARL